MCPVTCEHALIDDAGSTNQHCITWHDGSIAGDNHDVTWDKVSRHRFFNLCIKSRWGEKQKTKMEHESTEERNVFESDSL